MEKELSGKEPGERMNYAESRAYEIRRLSYDQLIALKVYENKLGRCFMPHEIQVRFNLPPLKATWLIPEVDTAQGQHSIRIQGEMFKEKIYPAFSYLSPLDVERCHQFDAAISEANIDFVYSGGAKKSKFRDQLGEE